jgi:hypothetical protein
MDVGGWLRSLGLGQYEALFRANEIDVDILSELTEIDLEKLGVPLGHRKRLLRAISGLTAAETLAVPSSSTGSKPHDTAERRQLTVMFCDLVGSTALSVRLEPEELRDEIRAYQNACAGGVARYDGFVAKFMGDGVLYLGQGTSGAGNERRFRARPRIGELRGRPVVTVLRLFRSLDGAFHALGTRADAGNGRAVPARSHGPPGLSRGCDRAPQLRHHLLVFRRLCRCSRPLSEESQALRPSAAWRFRQPVRLGFARRSGSL